ncbi:hypothetical protein AB0L65_51790 [Nonomuraea sp. NPDC052116]|uniref:hypothetical protein n=1 Tax=Nonomuraea sp. NPDC052116 TaxID=3155665 RepID=UPI003416203C
MAATCAAGSSGSFIELGELAFGGGQVNPLLLDLAEPAFTFGLGQAGDHVVPDPFQARSIGLVDPQK